MPLALTNDIHTYYEVHGDGPPMVLVHGAGATFEMWRPQIKHFSRHFKVVVYDLRGHGRSQGRGERYSATTFARDLKALAEHLALGRFVLVGLSFGGVVAQRYASMWPDDLAALVLADTAVAAALGWSDHALKALFPLPLIEGLIRRLSPKQYAMFSFWFYRKLRSPAREFLAGTQIAMDREELVKVVGAMYRLRAVDLSRVSVPVLIMVGAEERRAVLAHAGELLRRLPQARTVVVPRARHAVNLENAEAFDAALLSFLTGVPLAAPARR